jgi:ketosteroid isomerase-like protein
VEPGPTEKPILGVRATVCCRKIDGTWMVTHEYVSMPFYMDPPFKAAVDLKP